MPYSEFLHRVATDEVRRFAFPALICASRGCPPHCRVRQELIGGPSLGRPVLVGLLTAAGP